MNIFGHRERRITFSRRLCVTNRLEARAASAAFSVQTTGMAAAVVIAKGLVTAGEIRALLANKGTPIGPLDVLIAGQAKARQLTLITRNTNEFRRVIGLQIENWISIAKSK